MEINLLQRRKVLEEKMVWHNGKDSDQRQVLWSNQVEGDRQVLTGIFPASPREVVDPAEGPEKYISIYTMSLMIFKRFRW